MGGLIKNSVSQRIGNNEEEEPGTSTATASNSRVGRWVVCEGGQIPVQKMYVQIGTWDHMELLLIRACTEYGAHVERWKEAGWLPGRRALFGSHPPPTPNRPPLHVLYSIPRGQ